MVSRLNGKQIIFSLEGLELGGAERQILLLANYLIHSCGAKVQIWGFRDPGRTVELCEAQGIPWRYVPLTWPQGRMAWVYNVLHLASELRRETPDVVLPYGMFSNIFCGLAWRLSGAKLCVWNQRDEGRYLTGRSIERWAVRLTPKFISNSSHGAGFLMDTYGIDPERVKVVYNGIVLQPAENHRETWRTQLGVRSDTFLACMVANLHSFKDHLTLLRAWRRLVDELEGLGDPPVLLLAGRFGDMTDRLKALAYDLELGRTVRFLGRVDDITGLLAACDLGVFSSKTEGCPNGVLESMAAGLAVVATDIPGIREALGDDYPCLVPAQDPDAFAECIAHLVADLQSRSTIGARNRHRIAEAFNPERMCEATAAYLADWLE